MEVSFVPPPEAPVYEPTPEEFLDPIAYIAGIRPQAEKFGICKIRPPSHWQPPFAVNTDDFKFVPRIQRLNELEAKSRIRMYFLNDLAKFWELQNNALKKQVIENKTVDLYHLRKFVQERDGYHKVSKDGKWKTIALLLGHLGSNEVAVQLQKIYEKTLLPYDVVISGAAANRDQKARETSDSSDKSEVKEEKKLDIMTPPPSCDGERSLDSSLNKSTDSNSLNQSHALNSELRKLQFYGAGPRMAVADLNELDPFAPKRTRPRSKGGKLVNISGKTCEVCGGTEGELGFLITCSTCPASYHHSCSIISPKSGARRPWRCHHCIAKECKKPMPSFGFEESKIEYSLKSFGRMADEFKANHFKTPCHEVPCSTVEKEFWRLVNSLESDVVVEYGADIHTLTAGSGFPTERNRHTLTPDEQEYISSMWNLNNLPILPRSLLRYIDVEINGMKVPWVYVGMCFSSFAWHIEDHWNYSINYLHWGEPKTWYGVPGAAAEQLEECMKKNATELFEEFPDLLHHITTIMNPNVLMSSGVPIFRTDQHAGEFVVTFPRSYHSGFNQGYNFAEAVNFCTSDWLPFGHDCIDNYRLLKRQCVFSNDEFVCRIVTEANDLTSECIVSLLQVFKKIMKRQEEVLKRLEEKNITNILRKDFQELHDDERQCDFCYTTCFLSAVTCKCSISKMACPCHIDETCKCPSGDKTFLFQYSMDELKEMEKKLSSQLEGFSAWSERARRALEAKGRFKLKLETMKGILNEAIEKNYPLNSLVVAFKSFCKKADRYFYIVRTLSSAQGSDDEEEEEKPRYEELLKMLDDVDNMPCRVPFKSKLSEYVVAIQDYCDEIRTEVSKEQLDGDAIELLFEKGNKFNIDIPDVVLLHQAMSKISWLQEVCETENDSVQLSWDTVQRLFETGQKLPKCTTSTKKLVHLQRLIDNCQKLESATTTCLRQKLVHSFEILPHKGLEEMESLLDQCSKSKVVIPSIGVLETAIKDAKEWSIYTKELFKDHIELECGDGNRPYLEDVESHLSRGRQLPLRLPETSIMSAKVCCAKTWVNNLSKMVLKSSQDSLVDVLIPRSDIEFLLRSKNNSMVDQVVVLDRNLKEINFNLEREKELSSIKKLRAANEEKVASAKKNNFCICFRGKSDSMVQCNLCCDLFHVNCVNYVAKKDTDDDEYGGFLCPRCARTNRVPFSVLEQYLERYENDFDLRLSEAEVLKDLIHRAESWKENLKLVFESLHISSILLVWEEGKNSRSLLKLEDFPSSSTEALEDLLISGNLMEVSLPEKNLLRIILSGSKPNYKSNVLQFPSVLPDIVDMCQKPAASSLKGKRSMETGIKNEDSPPKKLKKSNETSPTSSKRTRTLSVDEKCSAEPCQDPEGDNVEWVQCDFCKKWFHFHCIGLQKIKKTELFQCNVCSAKVKPSTLTVSPASGNAKIMPAFKKGKKSLEKKEVLPKIILKSDDRLLAVPTKPSVDAFKSAERPKSSLLQKTTIIIPSISNICQVSTVPFPVAGNSRDSEPIHIVEVEDGDPVPTGLVPTRSAGPAESRSALLPSQDRDAARGGPSSLEEVIVIDDDD